MTRQRGLDKIVNCGEVTRRLRMTLAGFVWTNFSPSLVTKMFLSSWYMEDIFHMQVLSPFFRKEKEGQNAFLPSAVFQMPLTQNNQYARSAYLEVVCSELFHYICYSLFSRCVWLFMTPWTAAHQAALSFTISWSLLKLISIEWWCHHYMRNIFYKIFLFKRILRKLPEGWLRYKIKP